METCSSFDSLPLNFERTDDWLPEERQWSVSTDRQEPFLLDRKAQARSLVAF